MSNPEKKKSNNGQVVVHAYVSAEMKADFRQRRIAEGFQSEAETLRYLVRHFTTYGLPTQPAQAG